MTNSSTPEPVDLSDPSISPHQLQELAQTHPQQWDEILAHPNVYPGLADWIRDRQVELGATGGGEDLDDSDAAAQDAGDEAAAVAAEESGDAPGDKAVQAEDVGRVDTVADDGQPSWALPGGPQSEQATSVDAGESPRQDADEHFDAQPEQQHPQDQQTWGWSQGQASSQPHGDTGQYTQQFSGYQQSSSQEQTGYQQFGYGQTYAQPQHPAQQRGASHIDLASARTWGLFVAGGAAFLSLFGFIFTPTLDYSIPFASHVSAGGWIIVLLFIATVVLSLMQLLKPSTWMRFFFITVSLAAGFLMIGRALTLIGFFTMRYTGFSVLWLLFMSLVLVAGTLMHLAPKTSDDQATATPQPTGQQGFYGGPQQYGQQPGYGQQYGGYSPGGPQH